MEEQGGRGARLPGNHSTATLASYYGHTSPSLT